MIRLNRYGELAAWHPDCVAFIGSPTIWPGKVAAPEHDVSHRSPPMFWGLAQWVWWWEGPMWGTSEPRSWRDSTPDMSWRRRDAELPRIPDVADELAGSLTVHAPNLTEDEFVAAVVDGAAHRHLFEWADSLAQAVEDVADQEAARDIYPLMDLLRTTVDLRRGDVSPFATYLEAPEPIIELYGVHGKAMRELTETRDQAFRQMLRDVASTIVGLLGRPVSWNDLIERGASPFRPPELDSDDW